MIWCLLIKVLNYECEPYGARHRYSKVPDTDVADVVEVMKNTNMLQFTVD
jgi:hypothetical protein